MTSAKTSTALAKIAGGSIGKSTRRTAPERRRAEVDGSLLVLLADRRSRARTITAG